MKKMLVVLMMMPMIALAEAYTDGIVWDYRSYGADINRETGTLTIPSTVNGKPVTGISSGAFSSYASPCSPADVDVKMRSLIIPSSVIDISRNAFASHFYYVTIPSSVMSIGRNALGTAPKIVYVDPGDVERIKGLLGSQCGGGGGGYDVTEMWFKEKDRSAFVDIPETNPVGMYNPTKNEIVKGVLAKEHQAVGVVQVKEGKASTKGESKITVTVIGIDGKKYSGTAKVQVGSTPKVEVVIKKLGTMVLTLGENGYAGEINGAKVFSVEESAASTGDAELRISALDLFAAPELAEVELDDFEAELFWGFLPEGTRVSRTEKKWKVSEKPGKIKLQKVEDEFGGWYDLQTTGENISGLKLTYSPKTNTFKGSFKVWTKFWRGYGKRPKLKSFQAKITGIVINGVGYGQIVVKKNVIGNVVVK